MWYRSLWRWLLLVVFLFPIVSGCGGSGSGFGSGSDTGSDLKGRIVFYSDRVSSDRDDLFLINADGTGLTRLTADARQRTWFPAFSPNGAFIAFQGVNTEQFSDIFRINPDGTGEINLTPDTILIEDQGPAVSPDSTCIIFASNRAGNLDIYWMGAADGSPVVRLTDNPANDYEPTCAPDGRIVFVSERDGNPELYIMNMDGSNQTRLTNSAAFEEFPDVSPLGDKIAFDRFENGSFQVFTMNINGSGVQFFADGMHPSYSPDAQWIAFASGNIRAKSVTGTQLVNVTQPAATVVDQAPSWGP